MNPLVMRYFVMDIISEASTFIKACVTIHTKNPKSEWANSFAPKVSPRKSVESGPFAKERFFKSALHSIDSPLSHFAR